MSIPSSQTIVTHTSCRAMSRGPVTTTSSTSRMSPLRIQDSSTRHGS
ncbi:hypothetical protein E2C01_096411 [Portunus trituberculatus]|uniref:Uncharacterized protein n=1 Tax=Portunus trituberculatus TaxID=210409 RepID=A0A5B7K1Y4_PORTR|nr:hypothetical protein [Portunus trituberculatus]